jgi:hypothetical protein
MSFKKINFLLIALIITVFSACEKDDSTSTNNNTVSKEGSFKGAFTFKDDNTDTTIVDYVVTLTKIADNKYHVLSADGALDLDVNDNNGTISITDELKDLFTNFTGTLSYTVFSIESDGDDDGNLFQLGYVGTRVNTPSPTTAEEYFIFDDSTIVCDPDYTTCEAQAGSYPYFYFGIYNTPNINNNSTGGSLLIRTISQPTPGTYRVVDFERFVNEELAADECVVLASKIFYSTTHYSTGDNGTLIVTQKDGKLVYELNNVSVAPAGRTPILYVSKAKGFCK